jgi:hypothetical protein
VRGKESSRKGCVLVVSGMYQFALGVLEFGEKDSNGLSYAVQRSFMCPRLKSEKEAMCLFLEGKHRTPNGSKAPSFFCFLFSVFCFLLFQRCNW